MATSRIKGVNEQISTYGASGFGRDYTSLSTWEAATDNNLVSLAQSEVLECYDDAAQFDDRTSMAGATTNASYRRIIRPAGSRFGSDWQGHKGVVPGPGVTFTRASGIGFEISGEDYASIQDLIMSAVDNDTNETTGGDNTTWIGIINIDCLGRGFNMSDGADGVVVNCLCINQDEHPFLGDIDDCYFLNCTALDSVIGRGFNEFSVDPIWINDLADGNFDDDFDGGSAFLEENNASGDATAFGTGSRINQTFTFQAHGSIEKGRLSITDAGARNYGQDLSAHSVFPFDDDIKWRRRVAAFDWDIGCDQYFSIYPVIDSLPGGSLNFGRRIVR